MHVIGYLKANNYKYVDDANFEVISDEFNIYSTYRIRRLLR